MREIPAVVEVVVERAGVFVKTTSVLQCACVEDALIVEQNQHEFASRVFALEGNLDFIMVGEDKAMFVGKVTRAEKTD